MISPNIMITSVETIVPTSPEVRSAIKMESIELAATLARMIVQRSKFVLFLNGRILAA